MIKDGGGLFCNISDETLPLITVKREEAFSSRREGLSLNALSLSLQGGGPEEEEVLSRHHVSGSFLRSARQRNSESLRSPSTPPTTATTAIEVGGS